MDLIPTHSTFRPGQPVTCEVEDAPAGELVVRHLGREVSRTAVRRGTGTVELADLPVGGYGLDLHVAGSVVASTALDVLDDNFDRPRYGFVADFAPDRDVAGVVRHFRALHLNLAQLYDWGYRHAQLVGPTPSYADALGRAVSIDTVRTLSAALTGAGSLPLGYAAVYAVGTEVWDDWRTAGLFHADGSPYRLGDDFLLLVDPSDARWSAHLIGQLRASLQHAGLAGFHLDQYGWPKLALRADGTVCDLAEAFPTLLRRIRRRLPQARGVFNNVNDFPTWSTASAPQDAVYIEVWPPHSQLAHLAGLVSKARLLRAGRVPILAAYLSVFGQAPRQAAEDAARLTMATIFSHGGTHLLNGEAGAALTDPYYPRNHRLSAPTLRLMRRWYDFATRYGDLLYDAGAVDVTGTCVGGINEDLLVTTDDGTPVSTDPVPGAVWARAVRTSHGLVLHLVNLAAQDELAWDAPKKPARRLGVQVRSLRTGPAAGTAFVADPDAPPGMRSLTVRSDGAYDAFRVPRLRTWAMVHLPSS